MLDETKPDDRDTSDTQEPSGEKEGGTSTPAASKEADKTKELNDRLSSQGREVKALGEQVTQLTTERDAAVAQATTARTDVDDVRKQIRELKREGIGDNAEAIKLFQLEEDLVGRERTLRDAEAALTTRETSVKAREAVLGVTALGATITRLAKDHGVTEKELEDTGITDATQLEKVARVIGQRGKPRDPQPRKENDAKGDDKGDETEPASVDGPGGTATPSIEQLDEMPIADYFAARRKQDPTLKIG